MIYFTPTLKEPVEKNNSFIRLNNNNESITYNDSFKINDIADKNTYINQESLNLLNPDCHINTASNDNFNEFTCSSSTNSNPPGTNPSTETSDNQSNDIVMMNENGSNVINKVSSSLNNSGSNKVLFTEEHIPEVESSTNTKLEILKTDSIKECPMLSNTNSTIDLKTDVNTISENKMLLSDTEHFHKRNELDYCKPSIAYVNNDTNKEFNQSKEEKSDLCLILNDINNDNSLTEGSIQSNSLPNDANVSKNIVTIDNYSKPIKLNMVTTEPYPKYTPRVEKAIKKYENKQPKKECIVM